ncbi:hypothetical protein [Mesorhizobium sp. M0058]|uniref:hypothetical protein n=1 Tax=Mesorhizobium sp. M0058 TaxID=2956865 RepID=UPI00333B3871
MKHSRSTAEVEIRDAVVKRFRELWPDARIVHEMNVEHGGSRADVVAVQPDRIWICEIKSERDKLDRLAGQLRDFGPASHGIIVAAHEKWSRDRGWIEHGGGRKSKVRTLLEEAMVGRERGPTAVWDYPEPVLTSGRAWRPPGWRSVPWYHRMIMLLWSEEIRAVAAEHRVAHTKRTGGFDLSLELGRLLTGREIEAAVCKHLRARTFSEADPPIFADRKVVPPHPDSVRQESML